MLKYIPSTLNREYLSASKATLHVHGPHTEETGHNVQSADDGASDEESLCVLEEAVDGDPHCQQRGVEEDERPHVAVEDKREGLVERDVLNVFTERHGEELL